MKTYKITLICDSRISMIPDAQKVFGALCSIFINIYGEDAFRQYIDSFENEPMLIHSSMFPKSLFPMVKQNIFNIDFINSVILKENLERQLQSLSNLKSYKQINYLSETIFKDYIISGNFNGLTKKLINCPENFKIIDEILMYNDENLSFKSSLNLSTRVQTDLLDIDNGEKRDLFYDSDTFFDEGQKFNLFVKSSQSKQFIESIFKNINFFPVGSRGSTGKNLYKFDGIEEVGFCTEGDEFCLLSKCLPKEGEFDFIHSHYSVTSANYHTSKNFGNHLLGRISKISEGSLMKVKKRQEFYGQIYKNDVKGKKIYHYGIGFVF
jgi:CRISPR-associated protein Csm4